VSPSRLTNLTPKQFGTTNALVTLAAMSFLVWLVYFHEGNGSVPRAASLPLINAILNGTSAVLISVGLWAIRQRKRTLHMQLMFAAFASSTLFLVNYIYYHFSHGDTHFAGQGVVRPIYFAVLISHVLLSMVTFPMILTSFYLGLSNRLVTHRRLSRWTWAAWMYVSVTGVVVYFMLHVIRL
jgi:putative membrane protein